MFGSPLWLISDLFESLQRFGTVWASSDLQIVRTGSEIPQISRWIGFQDCEAQIGSWTFLLESGLLDTSDVVFNIEHLVSSQYFLNESAWRTDPQNNFVTANELVSRAILWESQTRYHRYRMLNTTSLLRSPPKTNFSKIGEVWRCVFSKSDSSRSRTEICSNQIKRRLKISAESDPTGPSNI